MSVHNFLLTHLKHLQHKTPKFLLARAMSSKSPTASNLLPLQSQLAKLNNISQQSQCAQGWCAAHHQIPHCAKVIMGEIAISSTVPSHLLCTQRVSRARSHNLGASLRSQRVGATAHMQLPRAAMFRPKLPLQKKNTPTLCKYHGDQSATPTASLASEPA
jgi:hypothetical protein